MAWSYTGPSESAKDVVRFLIGDVDESDQLISDEEIDYLLTIESSEYDAAAMACETIATRFAREVSHSADGLSYSGNQLTTQFAERAEALRKMRKRVNRRGTAPYVGGISISDQKKDLGDRDLVPHHYATHMHDHPATSQHAPRDPLKGDR